MTKKHSRFLFVVFSIILVIGLIACFVNFTYPLSINGNYYSYSNFVSNLRFGDDVADNSLRIIYRAELQTENETSINYADLRNSTINELKTIVQTEGYKDVSVVEYGDDSISLTIGNLINIDEQNAVLNLVGNPAMIKFATDSEGKEVFATGKHIGQVRPTSYTPSGTADLSYVVILEFEDEYKDMVAEQSSGKTVYIYLGETKFAELDYSDTGINDGVIYLQSSTFKGLNDAQTCANQIRLGMLDLSLTQIDSGVISASLGNRAIVLLSIIMMLFVVIGFVYMIVKFKELGLLSVFAMLFYIVTSLFLIQSIPVAHMNIAGIIAFMFAYIVVIDSILTIFNNAKEKFKEGTKLFIAMRVAEKESLVKIFAFNILMMVVGLICLLIPTLSIQSFGWVIFVSSFVSIFVVEALMRLFIKMYLSLNNENGKKCNFIKGGKND